MPTYEYECGKCGVFEASQRITDAPLSKCPTCRRKVRRLISNTSFQLKGSGWYVTDYARGGKKDAGASESGSDAKSESKSESKSETKTESKKSESKKSESKSDSKASSTAAA